MDISKTIVAKSNQLNSDDLIGKSITVKVAKVTVNLSDEQPVAINYEGDDGKPFKPCKTVRRIIAAAWGTDSSLWVGRLMTLYRDDTVVWAGEKVGGIRISHMSHLKEDLKLDF